MKPYFHELDQSEIEQLTSNKKTWADINTLYIQPKWCDYPNALDGAMGCWSLTDLSKNGSRTKISEEFCKTCDCFITK